MSFFFIQKWEISAWLCWVFSDSEMIFSHSWRIANTAGDFGEVPIALWPKEIQLINTCGHANLNDLYVIYYLCYLFIFIASSINFPSLHIPTEE